MIKVSEGQVLFVDHYDSFSMNVFQWADAALRNVYGNRLSLISRFHDDADLMAIASRAVGIIFGPGPGRPEEYSQSLAVVTSSIGRKPLFGICLGHQLFGYSVGARIIKAKDPWHGVSERVALNTVNNMFKSLGRGRDSCVLSSIEQVFYNSLVVDEVTLPKDWRVTGRNSYGEIAAMESTASDTRQNPCWSVQFHPESFKSEDISPILSDWIATAIDECSL